MHDHVASDHYPMSDDDSYYLCKPGVPKTDGYETKSSQHDMQTIFGRMLRWILLLDAHHDPCSYGHPCTNYNPLPNNNPRPDNRSIHLQKLLLPSWLYEDCEGLHGCMPQDIRMLCYRLLLDFDDNSCTNLHPATHSHTCPHNDSLPDYHALPHNNAPHLCVSRLPEANGHQAKSCKDCVQGHNWKNMQ